MKYALLMVFNYYPDDYDNSKVSQIIGSLADLTMMVTFCLDKNILRENITIITDLIELSSICEGCKINFCDYPKCTFVCTKICQFVENTIRGIEYGFNKNLGESSEVFMYISCHGSELKIFVPEFREDQGIVLFDDSASDLRFLSTKDIFNILFGRFFISPSGIMRIPIYKKTKTLKQITFENVKKYREEVETSVEFITVQLSNIEKSPEVRSPGTIYKPYRSSYNSNRGIPFFSNVLIIVDTCYSGFMTHFPYIYCDEKESLIRTPFSNHYVNHIDMPYCVCISSCSFDKKTKSSVGGSHLTKLLYIQFRNLNIPLNFKDFHYNIINLTSKTLIEYLKNGSITPVISSTRNVLNDKIPFFGKEFLKRPRKVIK